MSHPRSKVKPYTYGRDIPGAAAGYVGRVCSPGENRAEPNLVLGEL